MELRHAKLNKKFRFFRVANLVGQLDDALKEGTSTN